MCSKADIPPTPGDGVQPKCTPGPGTTDDLTLGVSVKEGPTHWKGGEDTPLVAGVGGWGGTASQRFCHRKLAAT